MRKLILISAFALASAFASVSAYAGDGRNLILAANDAPAAAATTAPAEAKPEAAVTEPAGPETAKKQASNSRGKTHARRTYEGDEAKARRIAARYGVYW
jgi:hypothetical protein